MSTPLRCRALGVAPLALLLLVATAIGLGAQEGRARIALFGLEAGASAARILPVTDAVADTMALTLALLGRYEVVRLDTADSLADTEALREYCAANRIDQAIGGSGTPRPEGGFTFRLGVYDRHKDQVTLVREGSSTGLLDVFEVTDELVTELLEALSGTHIGFGSLTLQRRGEQGEYAVWIDGTPVGTDLEAVERLLLGRRTVSVRQRRLLREVELLSAVVQVPEEGRVSVSFEIPGIMEEEQQELDRLTGIAKGGWSERPRAKEVEAALERGVELLAGATCSVKLQGMAEGWRTQAALHALVRCEWRVQDGLPGVDNTALEADVERFTTTAGLAEEGADRDAAIGSLRRVFALVRLAGINDFASGRWDPGMQKYQSLEMIAREALSAAGEEFWGDDALVRTRYEEHTAGKTLAGSRLRKDLGKEWQAAQDLFRNFDTLKGSELVVISDPPGRTVMVNGKRQGETPLRVRNLRAGTAPVVLSDIWYEKSERQAVLTEGRSYLFLEAAKPAKAGPQPEAAPAECFGDSVRFTWSEVSEARTYTLQLVATVAQTLKVIEQVTGIRSTVYTLQQTLEPGMRYSYRVRPVSADGALGPWSAAAPLDGQLVWKLVSDVPYKNSIDYGSSEGVVFQDKMWAVGGFDRPRVAVSNDGTSWDVTDYYAPFGLRSEFGLVEFKGRLWLIGGHRGADQYYNDIWSTADGHDWHLELAHAPFSARAWFSCLVLNGRIWVIGGGASDNSLMDVWSSDDGIAWRREGAPKELQEIHPGVVFENRMWHVARSQNSPRSLFSSTNGIQWDLAGLVPTSNMKADILTVYNGFLWLIGGRSAEAAPEIRTTEEVWYSKDGRMWKRSVPASPSWFPARYDFQGYEHKGKLWVLFGRGAQSPHTDVWYAEPAPWP